MIEKEMSRRSLFKSSLVGATAVGAAGFGLASTAEAAPKKAKAETFDAIVLGAGPAGLITAITAHDAGAKVVVLEKCDRPNGNAIFALGSICGWGTRHQAEQGIKDTADAFYAMMMDISKQMGDKALNRLYTDKISEGIDWLEKDIGVKFGKIRPMPYPRLGRTCRVLGEGQTGGARLVQALLKAAEKRGIDIRYEHKAIELLHDDKFAVTGVKALTPAGQKTFMSRGGVCIATGGFSGNPEMVDRYIGGWATRMVLRGSPAITGENISLTLPLFTKFVNMDQFHSGPIIGKTHVNPADVLNSGYGIQVNTSGNRYMDENNTYVIKARTTAQMTLDNTAWVIVDSDCSVLDKVIPKFDRLNSPYGKADTIEELALQIGVPPKNLRETMQKVNSYAETGVDPEFGRKKEHLVKFNLEKGPYYALKAIRAFFLTLGGVTVTPNFEAKNPQGDVIRNLYVVGQDIGGLYDSSYDLRCEGSASSFAMTSGRVAALHALKAIEAGE